jgi:glycosyltransferase involved in cell wall biosynthesis
MEDSREIRIALFVPWIKSKGGIERIILKLLENKKYQFDIYTLFYDRDKTFAEFKNYRVIQLNKSEPKGFIGRGIGLFTRLILTKIKSINKYDIFMISTAGVSEFITFRNQHKKTIALCHTPLRVAHTMYGYYRDENKRNRILLPMTIPLYKRLEKLAWKRIDYAFVLSEEVKKRLVNYQLIQKKRIFNLGPYANYKIKNVKRTPEKIIFYPSRFIKYKRQDLAIKAFERSELAKDGFKLVIAGFVEDQKYFQQIKSMENKNIIVKDNLTENELNRLYNSCYVTLFLAINEDTGLTPLESLAYGKPVIAVNEGGPKEFIINEKNGLLVNADETHIADALKRVSDKKLYLRLAKGAINSERYDENRFIKNFDAAVSKALEK